MVQPPEIVCLGNLRSFQNHQKILGTGFHERLASESLIRFGLHGPSAMGLRGCLAMRLQLVHHRLPRARAHGRIAGGQVGARDLDVQPGLPERFIPGVEDGESLGLVLGLQAGLFAEGSIFAIASNFYPLNRSKATAGLGHPHAPFLLCGSAA